MTDFDTFKFGKEHEEKFIETFRSKFDQNLEKTKKRFSLFDFTSEATYLELKSRRCASVTYKDTMVGKNKFDLAEKLEDKNIYFCFSFTDGLFYWKYNKDQLDLIKFRRGGYRNPSGRWEIKDYAFIPINLLVNINTPDANKL
jgi:hypothetical protein